jgi:hypothetical protein
MAQQGIYFIIWSAKKIKDRLVVEGRCGDTPIRIGDTFKFVFRYSEPKTSAEYGLHMECIFQKPLSLVVQKIEAYRTLLKELGQGMTGQLELTGTIDVSLERDDILGLFEGTRIIKMSS